MFVAFTVFGVMPLFGYLLTELLARRGERPRDRARERGLGRGGNVGYVRVLVQRGWSA